ncbi:transmembrane protein 60 [Bombus vosnesenskii]|uniref:Transmembrane protein 60 n=3 Tax=Pyrobombus TaxID=144703 RepID=A0A6J3KA47_9HYME|nr:transmembrane protein 60 [Bombus impatiens]XP_024227001.1 transmembrane protein 60 [Bombus impatiens]XP_033179331.1 transmembrane protein 60 [Bombus impatiens]XP_033206422.1 transmembrane protein 60 [Bombus vancouverensis nearcticus]XP_033316740.1 transmembrane protein 60 [Bombus bifarius]XP_033348924.1 transmembrane protein 60 [Bombus vosnesenskii]XP_043584784.1 transmembrane protein 60 [Bombus pyrosoma]XP_043584785.1 transmembrane protein 60 [Bombus pyrosoma]XP_050496683.1 transmembran
MTALHRALYTWFNLLIFLILLVLRLDQRTQWNWFIVFIPLWLFDLIVSVNIIINIITLFKNGRIDHLPREMWYTSVMLMKISAQILICLKLEAPHWFLPAKLVLGPFWILLPALAVDVFINLMHHYRY